MSKFEFKLPDIGEGVTEGEIVNWLVAVGDGVKEDQDLVEVMTDKATVTITAPTAGKVVETRGEAGSIVPVHSVLVVFDGGGGEIQLLITNNYPYPHKEPGKTEWVGFNIDLAEILAKELNVKVSLSDWRTN